MPTINIIISNIERIAADLKISQAELARRAGLGQPQLNNYLKGKNSPGLDALESIAQALEVPLVDLFKGDAPKGKRSLDSLRIEAVGLILNADLADVSGVLLALKGSPNA